MNMTDDKLIPGWNAPIRRPQTGAVPKPAPAAEAKPAKTSAPAKRKPKNGKAPRKQAKPAKLPKKKSAKPAKRSGRS